jgi:hypothetical protein
VGAVVNSALVTHPYQKNAGGLVDIPNRHGPLTMWPWRHKWHQAIHTSLMKVSNWGTLT